MNLRSSKEDNPAAGSSTRSPPSMIARLLDVDCQQHAGALLLFGFSSADSAEREE